MKSGAFVTSMLVAGLVAACDGGSPTSPGQAPAPAPMVAPQAQTATYEVTFRATWSRKSHPIDFPLNRHFTKLIGGTHDARVRFWAPGALASPGIEDMAERGRTSPLDSEVERAIAAGTADQVLRGDAIGRSPGTTTLRFSASQAHSLVTLVSMIAPSPDWFVGVADLDLFAGGVWADEIVVPLLPWDSGTDDGTSFDSPDRETRPHRPIALISQAPLAPSGTAEPMGSFTFRRIPTDG